MRVLCRARQSRMIRHQMPFGRSGDKVDKLKLRRVVVYIIAEATEMEDSGR